jgi:hypothetical protein
MTAGKTVAPRAMVLWCCYVEGIRAPAMTRGLESIAPTLKRDQIPFHSPRRGTNSMKKRDNHSVRQVILLWLLIPVEHGQQCVVPRGWVPLNSAQVLDQRNDKALRSICV